MDRHAETCCFDHKLGELEWDLRACCSERELVMREVEMAVLTGKCGGGPDEAEGKHQKHR